MSDKLDRILDMLKNQPNDAFLMYAKAKELEGREDWEEAVEAYEELKQTHPDYVGLYYHLADLYAELGASSKANDTYQKGIEVATKAGDQHALSELKNAYTNFQMELH